MVAHHVSLMAVQAEAVGALLPARPEDAAVSADLIGSTARAAMTELRRLLGVLRFRDTEDPERVRLTPVPSLSRLDELVDAIREAGLRGDVRDVRPGGGAAAGHRPDGVPHPAGGADERAAPRPWRRRLRPRGLRARAGHRRGEQHRPGPRRPRGRRPRSAPALAAPAGRRPVPPGPATAWRASPSASPPAAARWRSARRPTAASRSPPACR